jgi:4-hydroxybenzoyl-CoA reductase alpha subunit
MAEYSFVGKGINRVDAREKVTGEAVFSADVKLPGMLFGKIKRSSHPFAKILSIDVSRAIKLPGVRTVITSRDVKQFRYGPIIADELPLAHEYVRFVGDEVAAVAAIDADAAEAALDLIEVEYEELSPVLDIERAMKPGASAVHPELEGAKQNIANHIEFVRGEGEAAFKQAEVTLEDRFTTQTTHQAYLEPHAVVAHWDGSEKLTLWGATQMPFGARTLLAKALGIPEHRIRIIQPCVGGGFGGKNELHPHFPISALLAKKSGKPVKIVYTREEDFIAGRPRVSEFIDLRMGFKRDGRVVAKSVVLVVDVGAYCGMGPVIMTVSLTRPDCVYRLPNIRAVGNLVYTNTVPRGPFRGFGNAEMLFATESMMDMAAERLGIDPMELRLKNATRTGDITVHGWVINSCGLSESIKRVAEESGWKQKRKDRTKNRGIGMACQVHVTSNRAVSPLYDGSAAIVIVDQYGKVKVFSGESEIGQGLNTTLAQITAQELGVDIENVEVMPVDTDHSPYGLGTWGSRSNTLGGNAVKIAANDAKKQLFRFAADKLEVSADDLEIKEGKFYVKGAQEEIITIEEIAFDAIFRKLGGAPIIGKGEYIVPDYVVIPDKNTKYGNYSLGYSFSTQVAEVLVDPETGKVDVLNVWVGQDVGKALNPKGCEGQIEGGVVQGMGFAISEDYFWKEGRPINPDFTDYRIPGFVGIPKIHSFLVESNEPAGPYGAKSLGEAATNPTVPAIANAIYDAVGVRMKQLPMAPEKILIALRGTPNR